MIPNIESQTDREILKNNGYNIETYICKGRYGVIYKGTMVKSNSIEIIAIKMINLKKFNYKFIYEYLPRELAALINFRHSFILSIYDIIKCSNNIFICMEWANGGDLTDYLIKTGPCNEKQTNKWFHQICLALQYLHNEKGVAHRDIKLDNMLLIDGICKLTDFGFVKMSLNNNNDDDNNDYNDISKNINTNRNLVILTDTFCGTEPYLSPQLISKAIYNPFKADIWALGVSLFCLLNNRFPYTMGNYEKMFIQQIDRNYLSHRWIKRFSYKIIHLSYKLLEPIENDRYSINDVLSHDWLKNV